MVTSDISGLVTLFSREYMSIQIYFEFLRKHPIVSFSFLFLFLYFFLPDKFLEKTFFPKNYYSNRLISLKETKRYCEKTISKTVQIINTDNTMELAKFFFETAQKTNVPISLDSAYKQAMKTRKNIFDSEKILLQSLTNALNETNQDIKETELILDKFKK